MRLLLISAFSAISLTVAGCDRGVPAKEQVGEQVAKQAEKQAQTEEAPPAAAAADENGEMDIGPNARLTREYAGQAATDAAFTGADGRKLNLSDFSGRPLLVNVWATWCAPCRKEMPALDSLARLEEGKMTVIAISQDLEGRRPVTAFFDSIKITNLEAYIDPPNRISKALGPPTLPLPASILYDSDGKEVWRVIGAAEWDSEEMAGFLDEAV